MQIEVDVSADGVLTARLPQRFRGKHVRVRIEEEVLPRRRDMGRAARRHLMDACYELDTSFETLFNRYQKSLSQ
ncbi:hypothetical protein G3480_04080 [Thiorhodococcus mannitoliphagus]|uniref:Uncharacterized protein n=1 Tax=Thiorhodococcus mannitoliphagus TaxID=329406 RepID=A0A6P1DPK6_9GAMM|nr:hypothetical protein [Thiorhodococcus mannitoliphagus]NEX19500.1 hypothetical protein [Thiorhodococcus mannitoliphagus]